MRENIWKNIKLGFKTNKLAVVGAAAIILLALISIFAFLYPVDPNAISATERLNAPSMAHLFGQHQHYMDKNQLHLHQEIVEL